MSAPERSSNNEDNIENIDTNRLAENGWPGLAAAAAAASNPYMQPVSYPLWFILYDLYKSYTYKAINNM